MQCQLIQTTSGQQCILSVLVIRDYLTVLKRTIAHAWSLRWAQHSRPCIRMNVNLKFTHRALP